MAHPEDTPWTVAEFPSIGQRAKVILGPDGDRIATVYGNPTTTAEQRARRIVEAVNNDLDRYDKITDKSTHDMHQCSDMEKDAPWTMDSTPIMGGPYPAAWEIWGPDGDRVALVHGNVALDVTAEQRARRIVEAVNNDLDRYDKINDLQAQLQDMQERIENIEAHTKAVETAASNKAHRKCDQIARERDDLLDKIEALRECVEAATDLAKMHTITEREIDQYWIWLGKKKGLKKILNKIESLFDE